MYNNILLLSQQVTEGTGIFEANGKIGVVILVLSTIFVGLMILMFLLDRRVKKLEQKVNQQ